MKRVGWLLLGYAIFCGAILLFKEGILSILNQAGYYALGLCGPCSLFFVQEEGMSFFGSLMFLFISAVFLTFLYFAIFQRSRRAVWIAATLLIWFGSSGLPLALLV